MKRTFNHLRSDFRSRVSFGLAVTLALATALCAPASDDAGADTPIEP